MPEFFDGFYWFGSCGFSTKIFANNMDNFSNVGLLIAKMVAIKMVGLLITLEIRRILGIKKEYATVFLMEIVSIVPFVIISS